MSVYFITAREVGRVKIGHAANPQSRLVSFQTHSPVPLVLERVCEGGPSEEAALHDQFSGSRVRGEWFDITPALEAHMTTLPAHIWRKRGYPSHKRQAA